MRKQVVKGKLKWVKEKPGENVKIRNATPIEVGGIRFRSKLEAYCYEQMILKGLKPLYEMETFVLQEKFEYCGEKIRPITYTPDFTGDSYIIECKGFSNDA